MLFGTVPRKPHPMMTGNEYHSIYCDERGIIFGIETVVEEGKDKQLLGVHGFWRFANCQERMAACLELLGRGGMTNLRVLQYTMYVYSCRLMDRQKPHPENLR